MLLEALLRLRVHPVRRRIRRRERVVDDLERIERVALERRREQHARLVVARQLEVDGDVGDRAAASVGSFRNS